jgi:hypothetical protein
VSFFDRLRGLTEETREALRKESAASKEAERVRRLAEDELRRQRESSLRLGHDTFKRLDAVRKVREFDRQAKELFGEPPPPRETAGAAERPPTRVRDGISESDESIWVEGAGGAVARSEPDGESHRRWTEPRVFVRVRYHLASQRLWVEPPEGIIHSGNGPYLSPPAGALPAAEWTVAAFDDALLSRWAPQPEE